MNFSTSATFFPAETLDRDDGTARDAYVLCNSLSKVHIPIYVCVHYRS